MKRRTHKSKKTGITENSASIILEFDHNFIGITEHYTVIRSWNIDNGKVKEIRKKIKYTVLLVKPLYGCSTKEIFAMNKTFSKKQYFFNKKTNINDRMIVQSKNDLEISAFKKYPKLKILKNKLLDNQKAEFVRMTGSGSTLVVYFKSKVSAKKALKMYKRKLNKCWCILSKII